MKTMTRFSTALLLAAAAAFPLFAQQPPAASRGFAPDKVFAAGPIDSINEFNGNVIASIPLGETYTVSPALSYSFKAIHNGKTWDYIRRNITIPVSCPSGDCTTVWTDMEAIPDGTANAGFGWRVQFARFIAPGDLQANIDRTLLETPDGAQHGTYVSLHDGDAQDGAAYTRDSTYLRLRATAVDTAEGVTYEFSSNKLTQMHDQVKDASGNFVNYVNIQYGSGPGDQPWPCMYPAISQKITDSKSRTSYLCFQSMNYDGTNRPTVTDVYVGTPAGTGHYTLNQVPTVFGRENFDKGFQYLYLPPTTTVPALMSVTMPDGSSYGFQYFGTIAHPGPATGNFESLTLPTKGSYRYGYGYYQIPISYDCTTYEEWLENSYSPGVTKREQLDANGTVLGKTLYGMYNVTGGIEGGFYQCTTEQEGPGYFTAYAPGAELMNLVIPGDNRSKTVHYYSVWPGYNRLMVDSPDGFKRIEYGLPFTRNASKMRDGLLLSTETYLCTDAFNAQCQPNPIRATYVQYEVDAYVTQDPTTLDHNPRLKKTETVYFDDIDPDTDLPKTTISTVSNDDFDGLGHYRVSESAGFGAASKRRTTANFNPNSGTFPGTHSKPAPANPWLLNLFTYQETKEINASETVLSSAKAEVCFDSNTGFLKRRRTIAGGMIDPTRDLLAIFEPNGNGEVATESYYGGDRFPLPPGFDTCNSAISGPQYRITHDFASGVLTRSQYDATTFNSYDVEVYPSTSAISTSRDTARIPTTYVYDTLGRVTEIHPQGAAWMEYEYNIPTTSSGVPFVAVRQRPEGAPKSTAAIAEQRYYFDGIGRLIQRKSAMPNNQWATVNRTYDFMGRVSREYVAYVSTSPGFDLSFTPLTYTEYTYDDLGRNTVVKSPDGKQTTTAYFAGSQQRRTGGVATGVNQETPQTTRYIYDYLGRLTTVKEKNNTITAGYLYDIGDRLSNVQITGTVSEGSQSRSFTYDNRGFLTSEYHPENGTTNYSKYDARGHAWEKRPAGDSAFDLNMTFDSAERLKQIDSRNPYYSSSNPNSPPEWRPSKLFFFGDANVFTADGTSYVQGKVSSSQRHNYQPALGDILLTEAFEYNNAGRISKKTTTALDHQTFSDTTIQSFEQKFTYDPLGNVLKAGYPNCLTQWCGGSSLADFDYAYDKGYLASIPGFIDSISYYPTGLMKQVNHTGGVTTQQTQDDSGMARVKNITVSNYGNCAVPVPVINGQPADTPVNSGSSASLTVYASGSSLTYQWYNATTAQAIGGATASTYTTPPLTQTTSYYVILTTPCGSTQSRTAVVTLCTTPAIDAQPNDTPVSANGTATLTVHANGAPLQYQWYNATAGQAIAGATSSSYTTPVLAQTTSYYVAVSKPCGSAVTSRVAIVTVTQCTAPALSPQPSNTVVVYGSATTLVANATGTSLHYHWYAGFAPDASFPAGADSPFYTTAAVTSTSHYWVQVTNSCGSVNGSTLTVVPVSAPASVTATYYDATHIQVQWPGAANAVQYRILRRESGFALRPVMTVASSVITTLDTVPNNLEFLYCVQALDTAGAATPCSVADFASTRTFSSIVIGQTIYAAYYQQILDGINAVYDISGAAHVAWPNILPQGVPAPASNVLISAQQVVSLRNAVAAARAQAAQSSAVSIPGMTFTDPQLAQGLLIRAIHLQQLQGGLQ
jgi:YD repeat-containing protein